ncbi:glycosyltransferase family 4 protein [Acuticoccus mangrovi]|uniref:Glycosyltransferase family 4 protein n=1 Tax=Acuticoccus mangrovi TaxID=2796142 RepID=A0A934IUA3_9HYPH|nr:glycosyltransferase family 4 protein [Acuticoccus mangrovi]MBJ3777849.1 glycosyltransferase family 4 protein [Acuticoccus mangrovi]
MSPTAYIVGGYIPNGGTYMAYDIGRILHEHFGHAVTVVATSDHGPDNGIFRYKYPFPTLGIEAMLAAATAADVLVCNPSFSNNAFGLRFPGRKIMYVQDFKTFATLDIYFDHYVSVSGTVQDFLRRVYGLRTPVIPAFVLAPDAPPRPFAERPAREVLVHVKGKDLLSRGIGERVADAVRARDPSIELVPLHFATKVPHARVLERLGEVRTLLSLVPAEGFGLTPLEAMGAGTLVCGVDGIAGREYMRPGRNCLVTRYGPIEAIADTVLAAVADPARAEAIAARGARTARDYGPDRFEVHWRKALTAMLR